MAGIKEWTISLVMIGLFTIALLNFATNFANDNGSAINIGNDAQISGLQTSTRQNISGFSGESQSTYESIINSTIAPGSTTTTGSGQYAITASSSIGTTKNILLIGYQKIFGTSNGFGIFITTFLAFFGLITIWYVVKLWRAGLPD